MPAAADANTDVLILGGGHNGLVCAAYLAAAGLKVRVLERRGIVGGPTRRGVRRDLHPAGHLRPEVGLPRGGVPQLESAAGAGVRGG